MTDITMPQLGETVTEGTITKWFKKVGEAVAEDEALFEVSTDKVDSEVPSAAAGYVTEILVQEGETVDVGTRLAVLAEQPTAGSEPAADAPSAPAEARPTAEAGEADNGAGFENIEETRGEDDGNPPAKAEAEAALLMVGTMAGVILATVLNNGGGAWDNAKKYIESGMLKDASGNVLGKGSLAHAAAVVGDTVGDPFKDTAGPSLHVLIKLLATITLVLAPLFV